MSTAGILHYFDPDEIARDTLEFVRVQSETGREGDGSKFLFALMERHGLKPVLEQVEPGRPNVYCRIEGAAKGRSLLLNGHTDTIPIGVSAPPGRDGDWIIGRGAEDMKGGLVAMVHAAGALRRAGLTLCGDLWLSGVIGHETPAGKKEGPLRLVADLQTGRIRADAIVIAEGPAAIWTASLGMAVITITMTSPLGPIHTLKVPYASNPARWLGRLLCRLQEMEEEFERRPPHPLCGRERLNVGMVHGGDYMNRLPTPITVVGQRRWAPGQTAAGILAELQHECDVLAKESGLTIRAALEGDREPFETPGDHPVVRSLQAAVQQASGKQAEVIGMGLVGDANLYFNLAGVPTVYYGPAHETAHSDHERVSIRQLVHCAQVYALTALEYCGQDS